MKFKAIMRESGMSLLEKRLVPAMEKMGKICYLYLTRDHTFFLHNLISCNNGIQCIGQIRNEALFSDHRISSQLDDRIAFSLDLSLLFRALRSSAATISSSSGSSSSCCLLIKLVKKLPPNSTQPAPFLTFETKGHTSAVLHDVPISKPLSRAQMTELQNSLDDAQALPLTLVGVDDLARLQSFIDRMKQLGDFIEVTVSKLGQLHLKLSTSLLTLGAEFKHLMVVGERGTERDGNGDRYNVNNSVVQVSMKHFAKCLQFHLA
ncbi:hypothetical protein Droror1_Dr00023887 [Drosera rotundifolia]